MPNTKGGDEVDGENPGTENSDLNTVHRKHHGAASLAALGTEKLEGHNSSIMYTDSSGAQHGAGVAPSFCGHGKGNILECNRGARPGAKAKDKMIGNN